MNRPYSVDFPRTGEVVVEERQLDQNPMQAHYFRISIGTSKPLPNIPIHLTNDTGEHYFITTCEALRKTPEQQVVSIHKGRN